MKKFSLLITALFAIIYSHGVMAYVDSYDGSSSYSSSSSSASYSFEKMIHDPVIVIVFLLVIGFFLLKLIKKTIFKAEDVAIDGLVVSKYSLNADNDEILSIESRKGGIIDLVMSSLKIESTTNLIINQKSREISIDTHNLNGNTKTSVLLDDIASVKVGYHQNLVTTVVFGVILFIVLFANPIISIIGVIILVIYFRVTKNIFIELETKGGRKINLGFANSIMKSISMNIDKSKDIQSTILSLKRAK